VTDLRDVPAYTVAEVSRYANVAPATLRTWLAGRGGIIVPAAPPAGLSFWNFAEAWIVSSIRKDHGVSMQRIRQAVEFVQTQLGIERPLIQAQFKSNGVDLFVDHLGDVLQASGGQPGQAYLRDMVNLYLNRVGYSDGRAACVYPFVRTFTATREEQPRAVVIDPNFGFGRPVITGTGLRTDIIAGRYRAGESIAELVSDYALKVEQIEDALRAEMREAA
jgi:uncharacterized protein (DUF433 family)